MPVEVPSTPLETLVNTRPTPEVLDTLAYEIVRETQPAFVRGKYGMANPDGDSATAIPQGYEGFQLVKEETVSHDTVKRWWYNGAVNQDTYNYDEDYVLDSAEHPLFRRRYIVRRDLYAEIARESPLTGVWMVVVTSGGAAAEYDPDNPPAVTINGDGAGATASALVKPDGTIGWVYITSEGTGYTAATATVAGTATLTATVQSTSCVLVSQKINELPDQDPRRSLYVLETRLYQTFPGPILVSWEFIPRLNIYAKLEKQLVLNSTVPADNNAEVYADGVTVEYQPLTDVYSAKITTTLPTDFVWENGGDANDFVYSAFINHRFPDQVLEDPNIYILAAASDSGRVVIDFAWDCKCDEGYAGPCVSEVRERYTYDPTDAAFIAGLPTPTLVIPEAQTVIGGVYRAGGDQPIANLYTVQIPMSLHPLLTVGIIANGQQLPVFDGTFVGTETIPATTPPSFSTGDTLTIVEAPERLGIDSLWMVRIITITHP